MKLLGFLAGAAFACFMEAWSLMLLVGIAHRDWWALMPTMGWHTAFMLAFVTTAFAVSVTLIISIFTTVSES